MTSTLWMYDLKKTWLKKWRCLPSQSWSQQDSKNICESKTIHRCCWSCFQYKHIYVIYVAVLLPHLWYSELIFWTVTNIGFKKLTATWTIFVSFVLFSYKSMPCFVLVLAITLLSKKLQHESLDIRQFSSYIKVMYLTTSMEAPGNYFIIWLNKQKKMSVSPKVIHPPIHPSSAAYLILVSQGTSLPWACHPALLKGGYKLPHAARSRCPHLLIPAAICKLIPSVTTQNEARNLNQP